MARVRGTYKHYGGDPMIIVASQRGHLTTRLKRIVPGEYVSPCGRFTVSRVQYDDGSAWWYWQDGGDEVCDHYATKCLAVDAMCREVKNDD